MSENNVVYLAAKSRKGRLDERWLAGVLNVERVVVMRAIMAHIDELEAIAPVRPSNGGGALLTMPQVYEVIGYVTDAAA